MMGIYEIKIISNQLLLLLYDTFGKNTRNIPGIL